MLVERNVFDNRQFLRGPAQVSDQGSHARARGTQMRAGRLPCDFVMSGDQFRRRHETVYSAVIRGSVLRRRSRVCVVRTSHAVSVRVFVAETGEDAVRLFSGNDFRS